MVDDGELLDRNRRGKLVEKNCASVCVRGSRTISIPFGATERMDGSVGLFFSLYGLLVLPWLAEKAPSLVAARAPLPATMIGAFLIGLLTWLVGALLVATPFILRRASPAWLGYVVGGSAAWMLVGNALLAPSGPASNLAVNLLSNMGPVILLVGLAYLARSESEVANMTRQHQRSGGTAHANQ